MSISTEDYLKAIYQLSITTASAIKPSLISQRLDISAAAVTDMLKKLAERKLIHYEPYKQVRLTKQGTDIGRNMVRRHRLLELFLHQILDMPWDQIHEEAERLEHAVSDAVIDRMDAHLGFPEFDPHGDPIPARDGRIPVHLNSQRLLDSEVGQQYEIVRVSDDDDQFLKYIQGIGLGLSQQFLLQSRQSFDQSVAIELNGTRLNLSAYCASHLWVRPTRPSEPPQPDTHERSSTHGHTGTLF